MYVGVICVCMGKGGSLLHDHDERIKVQTFVDGVGVYCNLIPLLADVGPLPGGV
jgi:hypothetical protein